MYMLCLLVVYQKLFRDHSYWCGGNHYKERVLQYNHKVCTHQPVDTLLDTMQNVVQYCKLEGIIKFTANAIETHYCWYLSIVALLY